MPVIHQTSPARSQSARQGPVCSHCQAQTTSLWRRTDKGEVVCNACGLYYRMHGKFRHVPLSAESVIPRKRRPSSHVNSGTVSNRLRTVTSRSYKPESQRGKVKQGVDPSSVTKQPVNSTKLRKILPWNPPASASSTNKLTTTTTTTVGHLVFSHQPTTSSNMTVNGVNFQRETPISAELYSASLHLCPDKLLQDVTCYCFAGVTLGGDCGCVLGPAPPTAVPVSVPECTPQLTECTLVPGRIVTLTAAC